MAVSTEWRVTPQLRIATGFALAFLTILVVSFVLNSGDADVVSVLAVLGLYGFSVVLLSASAYGSHVRVVGDDIIVANVYVTSRYPLSSVRQIHSVGYSLLTLELVDRSRTGCWAVQAPNASLWLKKRTRVEDVADELRYVTKGRLGTDGIVTVAKRWSGIPVVGWLALALVLLPSLVWALAH